MTVDVAAKLEGLRDLRARAPQEVRRLFAERRRRALLGADGRLMLVAADHPARGALAARGDEIAMANRDDLLTRLLVALEQPGVDGVLGTADILEDLLVLGALDGKVVIGSMNRGGLAGAAFEFDDRFTGYDVPTIIEGGLDGGKMLCRICLDDPATVRTLEACSSAMSGLNQAELMAMVEPFWSRRAEGRGTNDLSAEAVIRSVAVASGLGSRSAHTWMKLPVVERMDDVMGATTLPTLILGGDPSGDPEITYEAWRRALGLPGVRGLVVGRTLLYPLDGDVAAAVNIASSMVHDGQEGSERGTA